MKNSKYFMEGNLKIQTMLCFVFIMQDPMDLHDIITMTANFLAAPA